MVKTLTKSLLVVFCFLAYTAVQATPTTIVDNLSKTIDPAMVHKLDIQSVDDFLALTPKKYKEITGERLTIKQIFALKAAQKAAASGDSSAPMDSGDIPKGLYIVGALLGWSWLIMGLMDDFQGSNWWMNLLLLILCYVPGVIHAFIKMKDYY